MISVGREKLQWEKMLKQFVETNSQMISMYHPFHKFLKKIFFHTKINNTC